MELKDMLDQIQKELKELRDQYEQELKKVKGNPEQVALEFKSIEDRINGKIDGLLTRLDDMEKKSNRLPWAVSTVPSEVVDEAKAQRKAAFETFLRYGDRALDPGQMGMLMGKSHTGLTPLEKKALSEGIDISGGYLVPDDVRSELIRKLPGFAYIRSWARVVNTSRDYVTFPKVTGGDDVKTSGVTVTWGGENDESPETDFNLGEEKIPVNLVTATVKASNDLLEDSATDVVGLISDLLAEAFGLSEEDKFINGTGVKQPEGILQCPDITVVNTGVAANITADAFITIYYSLPEQYRANARWLVKGTTEAATRKLKDGQGNYLWGLGLSGGQPNTLLGKPITNSEYMPAIGASNNIAIFGDFKYYWIAERILMTIQRLSELYARNNQTGILAKRRVGGQVTLPSGFRLLQCHV